MTFDVNDFVGDPSGKQFIFERDAARSGQILDEPTAGLDIESRRGLWDLLLSLRGARTVLLSTHYMEEADALGDRVAALCAGELRCYATNMFLKKAIGEGYRLTLNTLHEPKANAITQKVQETVPEATVKERTVSSITYNLPANSSGTFPKLFGSIEDNKAQLEIVTIGVGVATLEEVFLKLGSNVDAMQGFDEQPEYGGSTKGIDSGAQEYDHEKFYRDLEGKSHKKLKGAPLFCRQFSVLLKRQFRFILYRKWVFLILQIALPYFLLYHLTDSSNIKHKPPNKRSLPLDLDMYTDIPSKRILCNFQLNESKTPFSFLRTLDSIYPDVDFQTTNDVSNTIARISKESIKDYRTYLSGIEINDTDAKVLYPRTVPHIAPIALNIMSNLLGMRYLNQSKCHILTRNYPIRKSDKKTKELMGAQMWAVWITFIFEIVLTHCVSLPSREYITGARNVHIMSGCSIKLYWLTAFLFHMVFTFVLLVIPIMLVAFIFDEDSTINQSDFLFVIMVVLIVGAVALIPFMFWVTVASQRRSPVIILSACIFTMVLMLPMMKMLNDVVDQMTQEQQKSPFFYIHNVFFFVATPYTVCVGMMDAAMTAVKNAEAGENSISNYFSIHSDGPCFSFTILLVHAIFFMGLVLMIQNGTINAWCDRLVNKKYKPRVINETNQEVNKEHDYVAQEITKNPADIITDSILIHEVHKNYKHFLSQTNAVKGISISVKKGECFGLLGVNGAGKTTTFKMLTVEECATRGKIYGNGYFLNGSSTTKYLHTLSYTPQHNGLDLFLTGEQNLRLLLTLRGLEEETVKQEVKSWFKLVDLEQHAKKRLEAYSGGCMRRLVAAGSLCGGSPVTLLDEPSTGVDVAARRNLWTALHKALRYQRSIVITSHSLDEMEALCDRIAIMCAGRVRALGSPSGLRSEYADGHAVRFKIKHRRTLDSVNESDALNSQVMKTFDCELKDSHMTMLLYHINVTMHYSDLFQALEGLKNQFSDLIEDYTVTDTTLEEVFLALAEEHKVPQPGA